LADELVSHVFTSALCAQIVHPSWRLGFTEATVDDRRAAALTFSGWWRSWPLLASGPGVTTDRRRTGPDLEESADFVIWAAEIASKGDGSTGPARRRWGIGQRAARW
jgi:hypothetical protein